MPAVIPEDPSGWYRYSNPAEVERSTVAQIRIKERCLRVTRQEARALADSPRWEQDYKGTVAQAALQKASHLVGRLGLWPTRHRWANQIVSAVQASPMRMGWRADYGLLYYAAAVPVDASMLELVGKKLGQE